MDSERHSLRWNLQKFKPDRRWPSVTEERGRDKSVTMAPRSTYVTGRHYVLRKPLFSAEQHASILKKTYTQKSTEEEKQSDSSSQGDIVTRPSPEPTPESSGLASSDCSRTDPGLPLGVWDLWTGPPHNGPTFGYPSSVSAQRGLSSSFLEVQRMNPPCRPLLSSTVLYPSYTPRSGSSRPCQTQLRAGGRERDTQPHSSAGDSGLLMSSHQANYWACAIPKALPPSPDRSSASWDPNREYQSLLDYTYPLRPGQMVREGGISKLWRDSQLQTVSNLQDSGIDLDHLCSSTSLSGLDFSLSAGHGYPDVPGFNNKYSDGPDPVGLSLDSLNCSMQRGGMSGFDSLSSTSAACSRSASIFRSSRYVGGEVYEEFLPLPDQLEQRQLLSRRVREVSAQLSRPVTNGWESLEPGTTSVTLPEKQEEQEVGSILRELEGDNQYTDEGKYKDREDRRVAQTGTIRDFTFFVGSSYELLCVCVCVCACVCVCVCLCVFQVFCSHLEQLIQQLYSASEKMELLAAPTVDIDSVKSSLAEYQSFQREVSGHRPLCSCVLHTGRRLLGCINNASPLLRDTLLLIERRCGALETPNEHFFPPSCPP
uniref:Centrosomal protein 68 n=1 Tax=Gasterosteus aculeatus aculeatus TaxID=481459 RepID=A0AAQ4P8E6_GASAC